MGRAKLVLISLMILLGLLLEWFYFNFSDRDSVRLLIIAVVVIVLFSYHKSETPIDRLRKKLDNVPESSNWKLFWSIFLLSAIFFPLINLYVGRSLHPEIHDDQMHAVQVQMLATGRLWLPAHPMADFFETFHIYVKPIYAPFHFPGTALLNVPGVWLHLPSWFVPNLLMSAACALSFHIARRVTCTSIAVLIPPFLWSNTTIQLLATTIISHNAMIFLSLLWIAIFLEWHKNWDLRWALLLSLVGGLSAITRPVDAIAFGVAILTGVAAVLYRRKSWSLAIKTSAVGIAGVVPFIVLQLIFNHALTGSWLNTPYKHYSDLNYPLTIFSETDHLNQPPPRISQLQQKQDYYEDFMLKNVRYYNSLTLWQAIKNDRVYYQLKYTIAPMILCLLVPIGLVGINSINRWVVCMPAIFFLAGYMKYAFYGPQYCIIIATSFVIIMMLGVSEISDLLEQWKRRHWFSALWLIVAIGLAIHFTQTLMEKVNMTAQFKAVNFVQEKLPSIVESPALAFCKYNPATKNFNDEPVYNYHAAAIDDNPIVLAQWLGDRNQELIQYYAKIGQNRTVYELDRDTLVLTPRGKVNDLAGSK